MSIVWWGMKVPRILMLEEGTLFRDLLVRHLRADSRFKIVGDCGCACEGVQLCEQLKPDVVVLDLKLPRINGVDIAEHIARVSPASRVLALAELSDTYNLNRVIENRLAGCVEVGQPLRVLEDALLAVAGGGTYFSDSFAKAASELESNPLSFPKILSQREQQVLACVAEGQTSRTIGVQLGLSSRTVEAHRHNIMKKLNLHDMAGLMRFAILHGFKQVECNGLTPHAACT